MVWSTNSVIQTSLPIWCVTSLACATFSCSMSHMVNAARFTRNSMVPMEEKDVAVDGAVCVYLLRYSVKDHP